MSKAILRLPQVKIRVGLSRSSIYLAISQGGFAKPIELGTRAVGWLEFEIDTWLSNPVRERRLVVDLYLRQNGGIAGRHHHPQIHERFRVRAENLAYTLNGVEKIAKVGQTVEIAPGTLHDFWNPGTDEALVRIDVQPAWATAVLLAY